MAELTVERSKFRREWILRFENGGCAYFKTKREAIETRDAILKERKMIERAEAEQAAYLDSIGPQVKPADLKVGDTFREIRNGMPSRPWTVTCIVATFDDGGALVRVAELETWEPLLLSGGYEIRLVSH